jgi:hypothetical protein
VVAVSFRQLQDPTEQKAVDSIVNCDLILNSVRNFCLLFFYCNLILNSVCSFSFSNFFSNHYPQSVATYEVSSQQKNSLLQRILQDCNNLLMKNSYFLENFILYTTCVFSSSFRNLKIC